MATVPILSRSVTPDHPKHDWQSNRQRNPSAVVSMNDSDFAVWVSVTWRNQPIGKLWGFLTTNVDSRDALG
jgi:hypothetical protein